MSDKLLKSLRVIAGPILAVALIATVVVSAISALTPKCPTGRTCIWDAGVSVVAPAGWSAGDREGTELLVLSPREGASIRIVLDDGSAAMRTRRHATLNDVEASLVNAFGNTSGSFSQISHLATERILLPTGPGLRVTYVSTTTFIMSSSQATDSVWFFASGRLLVFEWQRGFGEGTPMPPPDDMPTTLRSVVDSLQLIAR